MSTPSVFRAPRVSAACVTVLAGMVGCGVLTSPALLALFGAGGTIGLEERLTRTVAAVTFVLAALPLSVAMRARTPVRAALSIAGLALVAGAANGALGVLAAALLAPGPVNLRDLRGDVLVIAALFGGAYGAAYGAWLAPLVALGARARRTGAHDAADAAAVAAGGWLAATGALAFALRAASLRDWALLMTTRPSAMAASARAALADPWLRSRLLGSWEATAALGLVAAGALLAAAVLARDVARRRRLARAYAPGAGAWTVAPRDDAPGGLAPLLGGAGDADAVLARVEDGEGDDAPYRGAAVRHAVARVPREWARARRALARRAAGAAVVALAAGAWAAWVLTR